MNRRQFLSRCKSGVIRWSPLIGLLGFRFVPLHQPKVIYGILCRGFVTWAGRFVVWVR